jgi:hypothetical protein
MRQPYLLSGDHVFGLDPASKPRRMTLLRVFVVLWLLGGMTFLLSKLWDNRKEAETRSDANNPVAAPTDDLVHHLEVVNSDLQSAISALHQMDGQISRTVESFDREFMLVERRRLASALTTSAAARRRLEQARQEIDLVVNLKKENQK